MSFITEAELREHWANGRGKLPAYPPNTRFSNAALDFLQAQGLELPLATDSAETRPPPATWDKPSTFPVVLGGELPACSVCGQPLQNKPSHLAQLNSAHFAPKDHPRLQLRGRLDSLQALTLLTAAQARKAQQNVLAQGLDTLAAYCRELLSAEYHVRPPASLVVLGMDEAQLHEVSHHPDRYLGIPHLLPGAQDSELQHWLNVLRTQTREVEIVSLQAFPPTPDQPFHPLALSLSHALNRLSSAVYVLALMLTAAKF